MKFGHFDDVKKEYVISNPRTPYPWINYLGTQEFIHRYGVLGLSEKNSCVPR